MPGWALEKGQSWSASGLCLGILITLLHLPPSLGNSFAGVPEVSFLNTKAALLLFLTFFLGPALGSTAVADVFG